MVKTAPCIDDYDSIPGETAAQFYARRRAESRADIAAWQERGRAPRPAPTSKPTTESPT